MPYSISKILDINIGLIHAYETEQKILKLLTEYTHIKFQNWKRNLKCVHSDNFTSKRCPADHTHAYSAAADVKLPYPNGYSLHFRLYLCRSLEKIRSGDTLGST